MDNLTYKDIISRQHNLITDSYVSNVNCNISYVYENLSDKYSYNKAKMILENWQALSDNEEEAITKVLEVFSIILDNDNISNIENAASLIEGKIIPKLRNAKQTNLLNHYKIGWLKHKHTSMLNDNKDNETAVARAKANKGYLGNSLHPHRKYKRDIYGRKMKDQEVKNNSSNDNNDDNTEVAKECFDRFIHAAYINEQCDRVINNHNKLLKRFDLETKVRKCPNNIYSLQECVYNICELIDSYDIPFGVKYNIALENITFLMTKNCVPVNNGFVIESVTDYFLMSDINDDRLHDMKYIIENSKFFSDEDIENVSYLCVDEDAIITAIENEEDIMPLEENKLHDMFLKYKQKRTITLKKKQKVESLKIKKVIHDFKKSNKKSIETFKAAISRIFVNSPEGIINELPDIFDFVRLGIALGALAINPILGILTMITGFFLKMKISRERMAIVIAQYTKERDRYKKKMDEAEDEKKKEKYEKLYKQYKNDVQKLEMYENELYTDAENDKRMEEKWAKEAENSTDFDFDFDMDFNFDESAAIEYVNMMSILYEQISFTKAGIMNTIKNNISNIGTDDIYNITESVKLCNDIFDCPRYINILEDELARVRSSNKDSYLSSIQRIDAIKTCIYDINKIKYNNLLESYDYYTENDDMIPPIDIFYENLKCKYDLMNDTLELVTRYKNNAILEDKKEGSGISFTNKVKIASENLRRNALKLKDKDKQLSMKLDSEINRAMNSARKSMISDNRESLIKGTFLPSVSKCIHIALASGATYLINPVLAVVGLLGYIGCSKVVNEKERNLILDDIDIEIKMCDKYMRIAEEKDDLVAVREIMKTKRDLERQRSRILFNKKVMFRGKKPYEDRSKYENND